MIGFSDPESEKRHLAGVLAKALKECSQWSYGYVQERFSEPDEVWTSSASSEVPQPAWSIEVSIIQQWEEEAVRVIQLTVDLYSLVTHLGAVLDICDDNRPVGISEIYEVKNGVPKAISD